MSTHATLVYEIEQVPPLTLPQLEAAVLAVPLPTSDMAQFGATLISDVTTTAGTKAIRTIVFLISSLEFNENFPSATNQQASPFKNLYTHVLGGALGMTVVAIPPVIS